MPATQAARKREMIANLENDAYIKALVDEAYASIFTGSTTNTVAQKKVKRAFPEREAFDTWQFGAKKGMDAQDELAEMQLQMETVSEEMMSERKFHDEFNSKPRSKHLVLKDEKGLDKPGPYQDYVTAKWK